jgi:hypothetical protein
MGNIAHWQLVVAILALIAAIIGVCFAMPNLLEYIANRGKEKSQQRVRDILRNVQRMSLDELLLRTRLSEKKLHATLDNLRATGELGMVRDPAGRELWFMAAGNPLSSALKARPNGR